MSAYTVEEILEHIRGLILQAQKDGERTRERVLQSLSEWIESGPEA